MRLQVSPRLGGSEETISLRIREASLQPFPEVETPICNGPSRWVERRENVQFLGESAQLTGIRRRLHNEEIRWTTVVSLLIQLLRYTSFIEGRECDKDHIDNVVDFLSAKTCQGIVIEFFTLKFQFSTLY